MATTKYTPVSEEDDPLAGPVHPSIAELVRQEVQTAIKGLHETWVAPPSYSSSAPLLSSTPADDHVDPEANQPVTPPLPLEPPLTTSPWGWCKFAITMSAMILWMCGWVVFIATGVDPLAFSMLAFFLMLALCYYTVIVCYFQFPFNCTRTGLRRALLFDKLAKRFHLVYMDPGPHNGQAQEARSCTTYPRGQKAEA
jgi:hypothetical protein